MNLILRLVLLAIGVVIAFWLVGLLAAAVALPAILWLLIKVAIVIAALVYLARTFGVTV
jgi:hypothetical protein